MATSHEDDSHLTLGDLGEANGFPFLELLLRGLEDRLKDGLRQGLKRSVLVEDGGLSALHSLGVDLIQALHIKIDELIQKLSLLLNLQFIKVAKDVALAVGFVVVSEGLELSVVYRQERRNGHFVDKLVERREKSKKFMLSLFIIRSEQRGCLIHNVKLQAKIDFVRHAIMRNSADCDFILW